MTHLVDASVNFIDPSAVNPVVQEPAYGEDAVRNYAYEPHTVTIANGRLLQPVPTLDREGFELRRSPTILRNFSDDDMVVRVYHPKVERLIKEATGASDVVVFDHTIRLAEHSTTVRAPVYHAHNDYTAASAPKRVIDLLGEEKGRKRLGNRFAQINVWRPIGDVVQSAPLALADAQTVREDLLVPTTLDYENRRGEVYELKYDPAIRWVTFPNMTPDEVVLIKGYDSAADDRAKLSPHTAFIDPTTPEDAPARKSIEVRAFAFFDD